VLNAGGRGNGQEWDETPAWSQNRGSDWQRFVLDRGKKDGDKRRQVALDPCKMGGIPIDDSACFSSSEKRFPRTFV